MEIIPMLLKEMEHEAQTTRKMLQRVPDDKLDWKAHEKSMSIRQVATHIAELPGWVTMTLTTNELDFAANPYDPKPIANNKELMAYFEETLADGKAHLEKANETLLMEPWTLRRGDQIFNTSPKVDVIRMTYCQIVHHRAQLGVYLRLLNVPIPGSYGPSADEMNF